VNKYKVFFLFLIVSSTLPLLAMESVHTKEWTSELNISQEYTISSSIRDSERNIYITGMSDKFSITNSSIFLAKYSSDATKTWAKSFENNASINSNDIVLDKTGNIYVTGDLNNSAYVFLNKYSGTGKLLWTKTFDAEGLIDNPEQTFNASNSVAVDSKDNVYIAGYTTGNLIPNSNTGKYDMLFSKLRDAFLAKYDSNGNRVWIKQFGTSFNDSIQKIEIDKQDNIYVAGSTAGIMDTLVIEKRNFDSFFAQYDSDGNMAWVKQIGLDGSQILDINSNSNGYIYIIGSVRDNFDGNSTFIGGSDAFILKYTNTGRKVWVKQFGSTDSDSASQISIDSEDNLYVVWSTVHASREEFYTDIFITKFSSLGVSSWTEKLVRNKYASSFSIDIDNSDNLDILWNKSKFVLVELTPKRKIGVYDSEHYITRFKSALVDSNTLSYASTNWHLISTPICKDINASELNVNVVYEYDPSLNRYFVTDKIKPKIGYWVKPSSEQNISFENIIDSISKDEMFSQMKSIFKKDSWNLLGTCHLTSTTEIKERLGNEMIWSYDSKKSYYKVPQTINAGTGFWVK